MNYNIAAALAKIIAETGEAIRFHDSRSRILPSDPSKDCWLQQARLAPDGSAVIDYSIVGQKGVYTQSASTLRLDDIAPIVKSASLLVLGS